MVTLTAEDVHDLLEAFFATYYTEEEVKTNNYEVFPEAIETGRKG